MGLRLMSQLKKADQIWGRQQDLYYWVGAKRVDGDNIQKDAQVT